MHIIQSLLFDFEAFITSKSNDRLVMVLEELYRHITKDRVLREVLSAFVEAPPVSQIHQLGRTFQAVETTYWSTIKLNKGFDQDILRKALGRFYLHGYL